MINTTSFRAAMSELCLHAGLNADHRLDQSIDGITGATLSHRAAKRITRLALILHQQVVD